MSWAKQREYGLRTSEIGNPPKAKWVIYPRHQGGSFSHPSLGQSKCSSHKKWRRGWQIPGKFTLSVTKPATILWSGQSWAATPTRVYRVQRDSPLHWSMCKGQSLYTLARTESPVDFFALPDGWIEKIWGVRAALIGGWGCAIGLAKQR